MTQRWRGKMIAGRMSIIHRSSTAAVALAAALLMSLSVVQAVDDSKYPGLNGRWVRVGGPNWVQPADLPQFHPIYDPRSYLTPPPGLLTPEYQPIYDSSQPHQPPDAPDAMPSTSCIPQTTLTLLHPSTSLP